MKLSALICGHIFLILLNVWLTMVGNVDGSTTTTKYYITQRQLKNRLDEMRKTRDPIRTSNSNVYYIDEAAESQEYGEMGGAAPEMGSFGAEKGLAMETPMMMMMERKGSKFLSEEVIFVIVIVGLALFLCFLSSLIVPIALLIISGGFMSPLGGIGLGAGGYGGMGPGMIGRRRRRRRSLPSETLLQHYREFEKALKKFNTI